ncbi:MAG: hypothetical protein CMI25_06135 [Opitutae bacterium]|nr:hypothetical protein [Opitutae bacterium]
MDKAAEAYRAGKVKEAVQFADRAVAAEPKNPRLHFFKGQLHNALREYDKSITAYTKALALKPPAAIVTDLHQERGEAYFKAAKIKESIADFDAYLKDVPRQDPHHWQRGISYYYADEFKKGYEQFERHQTVNSNDVENAVWHFLCLARAKGIEEAKKKLIPIVGDGRIPMMEVLALFGGKSTPEKVLAKAKANGAAGPRLERQIFYAHLYLGLWYEAKKELKLRDKYISLAATVADQHGYMGDVARVHAVLNKIKVPKPAAEK